MKTIPPWPKLRWSLRKSVDPVGWFVLRAETLRGGKLYALQMGITQEEIYMERFSKWLQRRREIRKKFRKELGTSL